MNFGSGYTRIPGYIRIDVDENIDADEHFDITKLDNYKSNYADEIYTAHTLEHISQKDLFNVLRSFFRILKENSLLTIIVPDSQRLAFDWADGKICYRIFQYFLLGPTPDVTAHMQHLNVFCEDKLRRHLFVAGFSNLQKHYTKNRYELKMTGRKVIC